MKCYGLMVMVAAWLVATPAFAQTNAEEYVKRGTALRHKGEHDKAVADYSEAIRLEPKYAKAYTCRAFAYMSTGEYDKAISDLKEAIRLDPKNAPDYQGLAHIFATCPDDKYRDGKAAVQNATKACELNEWKSVSGIADLAAAYAEVGDFEQAVKWQTKAVELVNERAKPLFTSRLELYRSRKPYRAEPVKKRTSP